MLSDDEILDKRLKNLQEQQQLLQDELQRLGGIKLTMKSAAVLLQEVVAEMNEVCPALLDSYQVTINGFFNQYISHLSLDQLNELTIYQIRRLAKAKGKSPKGKRWEIALRLEGLISEKDIAALSK